MQILLGLVCSKSGIRIRNIFVRNSELSKEVLIILEIVI